MTDTRSADLQRRAELLAQAGDLATAARLLVEAGFVHQAAGLVDGAVLALSARHEHANVVAAVEALPVAARSLVARIARADATVGTGHAQTAELQELVEAARAADRVDLAVFTCAVVVDHLVLHGDPSAVLLAMQYLADLPTDPLPRPLVLVARARLGRALALAKLFIGPSAHDDADADYRASLADFNRAGWQVDRWLTVAAFHAVRASTTWAASRADQLAVTEARDQLLAAGSSQAAWARYALTLTAFTVGDVATVQAEADQLMAGDDRRLSFLGLLAEHADALTLLILVGSGPRADAAVAQIEVVMGAVRRDFPLLSGTLMVQTTHALTDAGRAKEAATAFGRLQALGMLMPHEPFEREVLASQIALLDAASDRGRVPADVVTDVTERLDAALGGLTALRHLPMARGLALRSAVTARRTSCADLADHLLAWVDEHVPSATEPTWWELRLRRAAEAVPETEAGDDSAAYDDGAADSPSRSDGRTDGHRLSVLVPSVTVLVGGRERRLAPAVARILAVLAVLDRPISTEQLVDMIWPDTDVSSGRARLKSAHHRLRQALAPAGDALLRRDGDVWSLAPTGAWAVDLHEFRALSRGDQQERLAAFRLPDGVLWQVQFPYDDVLAEHRTPLELTWRRLADQLLQESVVTLDEVRQRATRLGLDVDDLG